MSSKIVSADADGTFHLEEIPEECPACMGTLVSVGMVVIRAWYRCQDCGLQYSTEVKR